MKKKYLLGILFSIFTTIFISACNSPSSINAKFNKDEYILSIGESVDFMQELEIAGIDEEDVVISSSNTQLIDIEAGKFVAKESGQAYILAKYQDKLVAQTKVKVRYRFSSLQNLKVSDAGVLSWDKSYLKIDSKIIEAKNYSLSYGMVVDGQETTYTTKTLSSNSFALPNGEGIYAIKLQALSHSNEYESSDIFQGEVNHGYMGHVENITLSNNNENGNATVSWNEKEKAKFDVYIEGFKVESDITNNFFTYNFDTYQNATEIHVEIIAKANGQIGPKESSTKITLIKPQAPTITVENGVLSLSECDYATGYLLQAVNKFDMTLPLNQRTTSFAGKESGLYYVRAKTLGSQGDGLVLNSAVSESMTVAKLPTVEFDIEMVGMVAKLNFAEREYSQNVKLAYSSSSLTVASDVSQVEVDLSSASLESGMYTFSAQAVPSTGSIFEVEGQGSTTKILSSDFSSASVYKLGEIEGITHSLDGTTSTISFEAPTHATHYALYLNETLITEEFTKNGSTIAFTIENLNTYQPTDEDTYQFKVVAVGKQNGKIITTISEKSKEISILPLPEDVTEEINGYFSWGDVEGAKYSYKILSVDSHGIVLDETPVIQGETDVPRVSINGLSVGYYKVVVKALSSDDNLYLDADFIDQTKEYVVYYALSQSIETPEVSFVDDNGVYKVEITPVNFAGKYTISIDGQQDSVFALTEPLWDEAGTNKITCVLSETFSEAGDYQISVIAEAGDLYDGAIHTTSQASSLTVTRIAGVACRSTLAADSYGRLASQLIIAPKIEHVSALKAYRGQTEVEAAYNAYGNVYEIDMNDTSVYGSSFEMTLSYVAQEAEGDHYYLDSHAYTYPFARVQTPTNLSYNSGILSYENADDKVAGYIVCLTTVQERVGGASPAYNYYYQAFQTEQKSFNLQEVITYLCEEVAEFNTAYNQMNYLKVDVTALQNTAIDGVNYLPSLPSESITIEDLNAVELSFDWQSQTLSWTGGVQGGKYDLYINRTAASSPNMSNLTNTSIKLSEINGLDLTKVQSISIVSKHSAYFDSKESNAIKIKQLDYVKTVTISKIGSDYIASIAIPSDSTSVQAVTVNGDEINYTLGQATAQFVVGNAGANVVQLLAKQTMVDGVYYLDSAQRTFTMQELGQVAVSINGGQIVWNNPSENIMVGTSATPYIFQLTFKDQSVEATYTTTNTQISISEIESLFNVDLNDNTEDFTIDVSVVFNSSYTLNIEDDLAVGLFGESQTQDSASSYKLKGLANVSVDVAQSEDTDEVAKQMNGTLNISFTDLWSDFTNVNFVINANGKETLTIPARDSTLPGVYTLRRSAGEWTLSMALGYFDSEALTLKFSVSSEGKLPSDEVEVGTKRFAQVSNVSLSPEGILTVTDTQENASYAISLTLGGEEAKSKTFTQSEIASIDLTTSEWLGGLGAGDYTISVVAFDANKKIMPSLSVYKYMAHQYEGIKNIYVDDKGRIILNIAADSYTNAIFTAKTTINGEEYTQTFTPTLEALDTDDEQAEFNYYLTMPQAIAIFQELFDELGETAIKEHTFQFTVRGQGGINSVWKELTFEYKGDYNESALIKEPTLKREGYDKDYIVFPALDDITTYTIKLSYHASNKRMKEGAEVEETFEDLIYFTGEELAKVAGYWIEGDLGGRFSSTNDASGANNEVAIECYAISLNALLQEVTFGSYTINVSRMGVNKDGQHIQFNEVSFAGYKLNTIYDEVTTEDKMSLTITDGYLLQWQWDQEDLSEQTEDATRYYVILSDGLNEKKFVTDLKVFDLRTCGIAVNTSYNVCVVALSSDERVIASNRSSARAIEQVNRTANPVVIDGKLGFDYGATALQAGTFLGDIAAYFGGTSATTYDETLIASSGYSQPYKFSAGTLNSSNIRIKFTKITESGAQGQIYYITVSAMDLLLDAMMTNNIEFAESTFAVGEEYSFYSLLEEYQRTNELTQTTNDFITTLLSSKRGIGTNDLLFDDVGASIPKGVYEVSFVQIGNSNYIESAPTSATRVYLSAGASIELDVASLGGKAQQYVASITPNKTATTADGSTFTETTARSYRMLLRGYAGVERISLTVVDFIYDGTNWLGYFNGEDLNGTSAGQVVYTLESNVTSDGVKYFQINLSLLRDAVNEILADMEEFYIDTAQTYQVDIFALSNGDAGVLNGKSGKFTLIYQDLDVSRMSLDGGTIKLPSSTTGNLNVRFAYASSATTIHLERVPIGIGDNEIDLSYITYGGNELLFVSFSLEGSYTYNTMKVESDIYGIANPYKLSSPSMSSINNNLRITYSSSDLSAGVIKFMDDEITYIISSNQDTLYEGSTTVNTIDYTVGLLDGEINADQFEAYLLGNRGAFISIDADDEGMEDYYVESEYYDHQLVLANNGNIMLKDGGLYKVIFKSEKASIDAKMLDYNNDTSQQYEVKEGSIYFDIPLQQELEMVDGSGNAAQLLYMLKLDYYDNQDEGVESTPIDTEILYLTEAYLTEGRLKLDGQLVDRTQDLVSFTVSAIVAKEVEEGYADFRAINGKFFSINDSFTYTDGSFVLRSRSFTPSNGSETAKFAHPPVATAPTSAETLFVANGAISFVVGDHIAYSPEGTFEQLSATKVVVSLTSNDGKQVFIDGRIQVKDLDGIRTAKFIPSDFAENAALANFVGKSFSVQIMSYDDQQLFSLPLAISTVYKLPNIEGKYEVKVDDNYQTYLDFQKYFEFTLGNNNTFYRIKIDIARETGETTTSYVSVTEPKLILDKTMTQLTISAIDSQETNTIGRIKLFSSDEHIVEVRQTEYNAKTNDDGSEKLIITWDKERIGFVWDGGEEGKSYEYFYQVSVKQNSQIDTQSGITTEKFYGPQTMGTVVSFLIQVRQIAGADEGSIIYIFSDSIEAREEQLGNEFKHFASGKGTQGDPYRIKTVYNLTTGLVAMSAAEQFKAISLRNNEGVYFVLDENIEIDIDESYSPISFNGHLDGNGHTVTVKSSKVFDLSATFEGGKIKNNTCSFDDYSSLFSTIASKASVSDLKLQYSVDINLSNNKGTLFAPLAAFNYGQISGVSVEVIGATINGSENNVFMSGIVSVNYGGIINCHNVSNFTFEVSQHLNVKCFGYAAITAFNITSTLPSVGTLINCSNSGAIAISNSIQGANIFASGGVIRNAGEIYACANTGNINVKAEQADRAGNYYIGGTAILSNGGKVEYCYNSGSLTAANGTAEIAGVILNLNSGSAKGLVDLTGKTIISGCTANISVLDCYVLQGVALIPELESGTSALLQDVEITGSVTYNLTSYNITLSITYVDSSFVAALSVTN